MRVAVCFSGQIRTGVEASENIKNFLGNLLPYCDFFIHTWNINNYPPYCGTRLFLPDEYITEDNLNKIIEIYQPKYIKVEDYNTLEQENNKLNDPIISLWYSFHKSIEYKKQYEVENNFEYDLVVKLRFDIIFPADRKLLHDYFLIKDNINNIIYIESSPAFDINYNDLEFLNDVYYIGNSRVMNVMSDYYDILNKKGFYNGGDILKFLSIFDIYYLDTSKSSNRYSIYRKECLKYSPINEFDKCFECAYYYYFNFKDNITCEYLNELKYKYIIEDYMLDIKSNEKYYINELKKKVNKLI